MALPRFQLTIDADTLSADNDAAGAAWRIESESDDGFSAQAATVIADSDEKGALSDAGRATPMIPASPPNSRYLLRLPSLGVSAPFLMPAANAVASVLIDTYRRQSEAIEETGLEPAQPRPGDGAVHHDDTLSGDGSEAHPLAVAHPYTTEDDERISAATQSAASAEAAAQQAVQDVAQEAATREAADNALGSRIDDEADARSERDAIIETKADDNAAQIERQGNRLQDVATLAGENRDALVEADNRLDGHDEELSDMTVHREEAWVMADVDLVSFADVTGSNQARDRIRAGQLPLNLVWEVTQEFNDQGRAETEVTVVIRVSRRASVARRDYRIRLGGEDAATLRLDSVHFGRFFLDADFAYYVFGSQAQPTPFGNVSPDTTFVMQHHGTVAHTSYFGQVPNETNARMDADADIDARLIEERDRAVAAERALGERISQAGGLTPEQARAIASNTAAVAELERDKQDNLTQAQLVELLQFDVVPGTIIGYTLDDQPADRRADWMTDWRVWVSRGETVGDVWMSIRLEGQPLLAVGSVDPGQARTRVKLSAANTYQFTLSDAQRTNLIDGRPTTRQGRDIQIGIFFYNAANGGVTIQAKSLAVDWLPSPVGSGLSQAQVDARIAALRPSGWGQIGIWGSTAGLLNNSAVTIAVGSNPTKIVPRNLRRLPAGVTYDNQTGILTLPVGVWRVTGRAEFVATEPQGRTTDRAEVHLSLRADVEGPTPDREIAAGSGYWRDSPGGALDPSCSAIVPVTDLGGGNDSVQITLNGQADRDNAGVVVQAMSAVIEFERIA